MTIRESTSPETHELTQRNQAIFDHDLAMLRQVGQEKGIRDFESRTKFGIDPATMLSIDHKRDVAGNIDIKGPKEYAYAIAESLGADEQETWNLIDSLHKKGPWVYSDRLSASEDAEMKTYIVLASATKECAWPGYQQSEYLANREEIINELQSFTPDQFEARKKKLMDNVKMDRVENINVGDETVEVPVAEGDPALALATRGYKGCVVKAGSVRFAQTEKISDQLLEDQGLVKGFGEIFDPTINDGAGGFKRVSPDTEGARTIWVKTEESGKNINDMAPAVKRIGSGYVLTYENEKLALDLVAKAIAGMA